MFLCISDCKQLTASCELRKSYRKSEASIVYGNEKLDTILIQVNAPENSQLPIANTQSAEKLDNIQIYESNNYLRKETKEECQEDTTENKADEPLTSLQRDSQSKEDKQQKYSRVETLHSLDYSVKEIALDSKKKNFRTVKRLKPKIKVHRRIMREEGSGRFEKLSKIHKNIS